MITALGEHADGPVERGVHVELPGTSGRTGNWLGFAGGFLHCGIIGNECFRIKTFEKQLVVMRVCPNWKPPTPGSSWPSAQLRTGGQDPLPRGGVWREFGR